MEMVLANYGVRLHRLDHAYLRGRCPLPVHTSKSSRESFIVNIDKNAWACHSDSCIMARGGRIGGNVLDFISAMESCAIREAALKLQHWFLVSPSPPTPAPRGNDAEAVYCDSPVSIDRNTPLPFALDWIDCSHPYFVERGVDLDVTRYFGIGYNRGNGSMEGRIVIPIHDENGFLVAYAGRSVDQTEPRYRFPARFRKSLVLFNLHRAAAESKSVIVVEIFFDCFNVYQAGLPCVVALMGCSLSIRQEELLCEHFREVVLLLDGDKAGRAAGAAIARRLVSKVSTRLVEVPDGSQPDQLGADQIRCLCIPGYF
jgi:hypothetical protein